MSQEMANLKETHAKQQEEMSQKRAHIDQLSTQMASLASLHQELRAKNNRLCDSARILAQSLSKLKEWNKWASINFIIIINRSFLEGWKIHYDYMEGEKF